MMSIIYLTLIGKECWWPPLLFGDINGNGRSISGPFFFLRVLFSILLPYLQTYLQKRNDASSYVFICFSFIWKESYKVSNISLEQYWINNDILDIID